MRLMAFLSSLFLVLWSGTWLIVDIANDDVPGLILQSVFFILGSALLVLYLALESEA